MFLLAIMKSSKKGKRFSAVFINRKGLIHKIIHFGSAKGKTYLDHNNDKKKKAWIARHKKNIDKFIDDPLAPITLAHSIAWNKKDFNDSVKSYRKKYNL